MKCKHVLVVGLGMCFLAFTFVFSLQIVSSKQTGSSEVTAEPPPDCDVDKRKLVVAVHGVGGGFERIGPLVDFINTQLPEANILPIRYTTGRLSNSDPFSMSRGIDDVIARHYSECARETGYDSIVLVGYSAGALLVRQAYLNGLGGATTDGLLPMAASRHQHRPQQEWTTKVDRIVLFAGMNRGWSLDRRPANMGLAYWLGAKVLRVICNLSGVCEFSMALERGAPFVANLRLAWVRAASTHADNFPTVVQILGKNDTLVTREDETDIAVSTGFVFIDVRDVDHESIMDIRAGTTSWRALEDALKLTKPDLLAKYKTLKDAKNARVDRVLFIRHGIRDDNRWTTKLRRVLCDAAWKNTHRHCKDDAPKDYDGPLISINIDSYGYFGMLPFLIENIRQDKVREFVDSYTEEVAKSADPDVPVDFLGHSNGTYVLAAGLEKYQALKVQRVAFANSVVRRNLDWSALEVAGPVRNYMGAKDWVVAVFPRLFELHESLGDLGSAGFKGFERGIGAKGNVLLEGGHGIGIKESNWQDLVHFFFPDQDGSKPITVDDPNALVDLLWKLPYIGWSLVIAVVTLLFWVLYRLIGFLLNKLSVPGWLRVPTGVLVATIVVFIVLAQI